LCIATKGVFRLGVIAVEQYPSRRNVRHQARWCIVEDDEIDVRQAQRAAQLRHESHPLVESRGV
jgi:hypothetical protein